MVVKADIVSKKDIPQAKLFFFTNDSHLFFIDESFSIWFLMFMEVSNEKLVPLYLHVLLNASSTVCILMSFHLNL